MNNLLTTADVAQIMGVHPATVRRMTKEGRLKYILVASAIRYSLEDIQDFLKQNTLTSKIKPAKKKLNKTKGD